MRDQNLINQAKSILASLHQNPKKSLGQNFLVDPELLHEIAELGNIQKGENVVEIGSGLGWLTNELIKFFPNLTLVEKDDQLAEYLNTKFGNTVNLIHGDILDENIWSEFPDQIKIIANIPYNLTTPLVQKIINNVAKLDLVIILVQKEVAQRLSAKAGNSSRGALTVALEAVAERDLGPEIPPTSFWPAPNVDSQILILKPNGNNIEPKFIDFLYKGFTQKRRKISNSISGGLNLKKDVAIQLLEKCEIDINLRPEDLELENWEKLWSEYKSII